MRYYELCFSSFQGDATRPKFSTEGSLVIALISLLLFITSSVQKLRAGNNGFDKRRHLVPARRQLCPHRIEKRIIRKHQRAAKRVHKRLLTQIVQKILLATCANITLH